MNCKLDRFYSLSFLFLVIFQFSLDAQNKKLSQFLKTSHSQAFYDSMASSVDTIIMDNINEPWVFNPITLRNIEDKVILFENGTEVKAKENSFPSKIDALWKFVDCDNITINGNGSTMRMNKEEYTDGEWRHVIRLRGCRNFYISNLTLKDSGGDGISIGGSKSRECSTNIVIDSIKSINNKRQGISIVSGKNIKITSSLFSETKGTLPGAGIDIEPDKPEDIMENIIVENCVFKNNYNSGIKIALVRLDSTSNPVSIKFTNCLLENNFCLEVVKVPCEIMVKSNDLSPVKGKVSFENCHVQNSKWGFLFAKMNSKGFDLFFNDCSAQNICQSGKRPAIYLETPHFQKTTELGGINFNKLFLDYKNDVPVVSIRGSKSGAMKHLVDIQGQFVLTSKKTLPVEYIGYDPINNKNVSLEVIY